jgi:hypothetical protein
MFTHLHYIINFRILIPGIRVTNVFVIVHVPKFEMYIDLQTNAQPIAWAKKCIVPLFYCKQNAEIID